MKPSVIVSVLTCALVAFVVLPFAGGALSACGYGKAACSVVNVVNDNCSWIQYLGPDGKTHEVKVDSADLVALGTATEAKQALARVAKDGGTDAGR